MITIREGNQDDISIIQNIAYKTWPDVYGNILSKEQLDFMLKSLVHDKKCISLKTNKISVDKLG